MIKLNAKDKKIVAILEAEVLELKNKLATWKEEANVIWKQCKKDEKHGGKEEGYNFYTPYSNYLNEHDFNDLNDTILDKESQISSIYMNENSKGICKHTLELSRKNID